MNTRVRNADEYLRIAEQSMQARAGRAPSAQRLLLLQPQGARVGDAAAGAGGWARAVGSRGSGGATRRHPWLPPLHCPPVSPPPPLQRLEEVDFPFIVFHSENDTVGGWVQMLGGWGHAMQGWGLAGVG